MSELPAQTGRHRFPPVVNEGGGNTALGSNSGDHHLHRVCPGQTERSGRPPQSAEPDPSHRVDDRSPSTRPVWDLWGKPHIDLFATYYNKRLPLYVSPMRDPLALGRDAFSMPWTNLLVYAYPPTALIPKVLAKWSVDRPRMILVAPFWTGAPWFPDLVALAQREFLHLRLDHRTLVQPRSGIGHANVHVLRLTAWLLSPLG